MELYTDEKWRLSKKRSINSATSNSSSSKRRGNSIISLSTKSARSGSTSNPAASFTRRCVALVKEQRARFYIMRRCVTMLVCWRDYA